MEAPIPNNEEERLQALDDLDILDTQPEETFDRITRLAAQVLDTPIALVSLVDKERQWFKSSNGLDAQETPREHAFCSHAILNTEIMVVNDARLDERFVDNPLVQGPPDIRFYAGAPLMLTDDIRLGTLCAIDTRPREITESEAAALRDLAAVVVDELDLRKRLGVEARLTRQLSQQAKDLRAANQALEQFAHMASHDLRAPLKKVINLADLAFDTDLPDDGRDLVELIRASGVELEEVIVGYWHLAKLEYSTEDQVVMSRLIDAARNHVDEPVSVEVRGDATLIGDSTLITRAIVNLIVNAARYASDDRVLFEIDDGDDQVDIHVSNAIEATVSVESIFAPFQRKSADSQGSGLGLAIVDRVMQLHGGSVRAASDQNTFTISLRIPKSSGQ